MAISFWFLLAVIFYSYAGYAVTVLLFKRKPSITTSDISEYPEVTIVVPAFNEAMVLAEKVENTISLNYPREKLTAIFVIDGSNDNSAEILARYPFIKILHEPLRKGKAAAINHAMQMVKSPIVIFTDANSFLNLQSLQKIVPHFTNSLVGAVAGEKKLVQAHGMGEAEGWYWKYESFMKTLDARFYSVVGAAGELFALRTSLFKPLPEKTLLDDFMLSLDVCLSGHIIAYEPGAFATEGPSASLLEEKKRKIRIAAGAFQTISGLSVKKLFAYPAFAFQFISRRWLRWAICPFAIILLFVINAFLAVDFPNSIYAWLFILQLVFYVMALIGWGLIKKNKTFFAATIPFYFLFMNYCMIAGLFRYLGKKETVLWEKAGRRES
jgi:poly-beta-1,6-N-acetyl-D-glucosamine synthase